MTTSNYNKAFKQLRAKPIKLQKYIKHNKPKERSVGKARKKCRRCGRNGGHISKYRIHLCRQCFREIGTQLGFKKYS